MKSLFLKILTITSIATAVILQVIWLYNLHDIYLQKVSTTANAAFNDAYSNEILKRLQSTNVRELANLPEADSNKVYPIYYFLDVLAENGRDTDRTVLDSLFRSNLSRDGISYTEISYTIRDTSGTGAQKGFGWNGLRQVSTSLYPTRVNGEECIRAEVYVSLSQMARSLSVPLCTAIFTLIVIVGSILYQISIIKKQRKMALAREKFADTVINEMKIPIHSISMLGNVLGSGNLDDIPETKARYHSSLSTQTGRLLSLCNRILTMAKLEQGRLEFVDEAIDLDSLAKEVIGTYCGNTGFSIIYRNLSEGRSHIIGDKYYIREALCSILDNYRKCTPKGETTNIMVTLSKGDGNVMLQISSDVTGIGEIPSGKHHESRSEENIFGIELDFAYGIVSLSGGNIDTCIKKDVSTEITIKFRSEDA